MNIADLTPAARSQQKLRFWFGGGILAVVLTASSIPFDAFFATEDFIGAFPGDLQKAIHLSEAFAHGAGATAILLTVLIVSVEKRSQVWTAILITLLSGLTANMAKSAFVRIRPHSVGKIQVGEGETLFDQAEANEVVEASFWDSRQRSFPSGHAATACGLAIGLSLIFPRGVVAFGILATLACIQRVISGAHFVSDVLAGVAVAFFCAGIVLWIGRRSSVDSRAL
ncbi:MAG: phosphatase PAP2 family protein [Aureliella sp.]